MKWFINQNNRVHGPYDQTEIKGLVQTLGAGAKTTFLWTRGMGDWIVADKWTPHLAQNTQSERQFDNSSRQREEANTNSHFNPPRSAQPVITQPPSVNHEKKYKVQYNFVDQKLMTREDLLNFTLKQDDVSKIAVFDDENKEWKEIYSVPEIAERLGISRRQNARVPILAQFSGLSTTKDIKLNARVVTISIAGMGLTETFDLNIGDIIRGQVTSPHFFTPLNVEAEVTYTGTDGYIGLTFTQINDDTSALITEYVNKLSEKS